MSGSIFRLFQEQGIQRITVKTGSVICNRIQNFSLSTAYRNIDGGRKHEKLTAIIDKSMLNGVFDHRLKYGFGNVRLHQRILRMIGHGDLVMKSVIHDIHVGLYM